MFYPWENDALTNSIHHVARQEKTDSIFWDTFVNLTLYAAHFQNTAILAAALDMGNTNEMKNCYILSLLNPIVPHLRPISCQKKIVKHFICEIVTLVPYHSTFAEAKQAVGKYGTVKCRSGQYISTVGVCDGTADCPDGSDESNCQCIIRSKRINDNISCSKFCSPKIQCICSILFTKHKEGGCHSYIDKQLILREPVEKIKSSLFYVCQKSTIHIDAFLVNDLIFDCPNFDDEKQLLSEELGLRKLCGENMLECYPGHSQCYKVSQKCVYHLTTHTQTLMYCRNGKHLQDCEATLCGGMFKCHYSYCVPHRYVCNGMWDCWSGEDEMICAPYSCINMFKCKQYSVCIAIENICDGMLDCPLSDDELICDQDSCFDQCTCLNYGIRCHHQDMASRHNFFVFLTHFVFIHISECKVSAGKTNELVKAILLISIKNNLSHLFVTHQLQIHTSGIWT